MLDDSVLILWELCRRHFSTEGPDSLCKEAFLEFTGLGVFALLCSTRRQVNEFEWCYESTTILVNFLKHCLGYLFCIAGKERAL